MQGVCVYMQGVCVCVFEAQKGTTTSTDTAQDDWKQENQTQGIKVGGSRGLQMAVTAKGETIVQISEGSWRDQHFCLTVFHCNLQ